jgi:hypothetical protein
MKRAMKAAQVPVEEAVDPKAARAKLLKSMNSTEDDNRSPGAKTGTAPRKQLSTADVDRVNKFADHLKSLGQVDDKESDIMKRNPEEVVAKFPEFKNFKG